MPDMLALLNEVVGPYPFPSYSVVIHTRSAPYANFQQELSILSLAVLTDYGEEAVMNGLSFQYFGNSVGLAQRQDLWLIQGLGGFVAQRLLRVHGLAPSGMMEYGNRAATARASG